MKKQKLRLRVCHLASDSLGGAVPIHGTRARTRPSAAGDLPDFALRLIQARQLCNSVPVVVFRPRHD